MKQDILNLENKNVGSIELNDAIFGLDVRADILHRVVNWQLARLQAGTHKTKGRSEVALTPAKPFKQKGSGNARQGSRKVKKFGRWMLVSSVAAAWIQPRNRLKSRETDCFFLSNADTLQAQPDRLVEHSADLAA